jgi:hypothetical protein
MKSAGSENRQTNLNQKNHPSDDHQGHNGFIILDEKKEEIKGMKKSCNKKTA